MKKALLIVAVVLVVTSLMVGFAGCKAGKDGVDGVSVVSASVNSNGHLILTLSNGQTVDAGMVKGDRGEKGDKGDTGQGAKGDKGDAGECDPCEDGKDGKDGISIYWRGKLPYAPNFPSLNDAYYDSTLKKSFVWNGYAWQMMAQDGVDGQDGEDCVLQAFVILIEKDDTTWIPVEDGAVGLLLYNPIGDEFEYDFEACGLQRNTGYSLIYYADPWDNENGCVIAYGASDGDGNLLLSGEVDLGMDIPSLPDTNYPDGKIWLVLTNDLVDDTPSAGGSAEMDGWNPDEYLFEYDKITYIDTDD